MSGVPTPFRYTALPMRVRFGPGSIAQVPVEVAELGWRRVLVVSTAGQRDTAEHVAAMLGERCAAVLAEARPHVPADLAERARDHAATIGADVLVSVGGGSSIGLAKAVALTSGLPILAIPSTYAGSEMTPVWGLTENRRKRTGRDLRVLPVSVVYDPDLTVSLPVDISITSGVNAMAHAVEALWAVDSSPVVALMAEAGLRSLVAAMPQIATNPTAAEPRGLALYGAWLCGACLGATTTSLHHKVCHALGGLLDLPHAATHTVVLPHVIAYNLPSAPAAEEALRRALGSGASGTEEPARALWEMTGRLAAPRSLRELGMAQSDIGAVAAAVLATPFANPRALTHADLVTLLQHAWRGDPPTGS